MNKIIIIIFRNNQAFHTYYVNNSIKNDYVDKINQAYEMKERAKKIDLKFKENCKYTIKIFKEV